MAAVVAGTAAVGGCSTPDRADTPTDLPGDAGSTVTAPTPDDPRDVEPFAETTVVPDVEHPDDTATIGVQPLTVEGGTTVLRLVVTPHFSSVSDSEAVQLDDVFGGLIFGPSLRLVDAENLKEYTVVHELNRWWATDQTPVEALNGEPMYAYAVFAAPEDDLDAVDVVLREDWAPVADVPVTR